MKKLYFTKTLLIFLCLFSFKPLFAQLKYVAITTGIYKGTFKYESLTFDVSPIVGYNSTAKDVATNFITDQYSFNNFRIGIDAVQPFALLSVHAMFPMGTSRFEKSPQYEARNTQYLDLRCAFGPSFFKNRWGVYFGFQTNFINNYVLPEESTGAQSITSTHIQPGKVYYGEMNGFTYGLGIHTVLNLFENFLIRYSYMNNNFINTLGEDGKYKQNELFFYFNLNPTGDGSFNNWGVNIGIVNQYYTFDSQGMDELQQSNNGFRGRPELKLHQSTFVLGANIPLRLDYEK